MSPTTFVRKTAVLVLWVLAITIVWLWVFCRVYVPPGRMLVIYSRFGRDNPDPSVNTVIDGCKGIARKVLGEGRHFYNPIAYERLTRHAVTDVGPMQVGVLRAEWGTALPAGEFLAGPGQRGIVRDVLTPGRYRVNPYAYQVTVTDATSIRPGFVGCVTAQSGREPPPGRLAGPHERGIQSDVLQPGLYFLNPHAYKVVPVEVGYREENFENVEFPSRDGFPIKLDTSVVWGILPAKVPEIVDRYGTVPDVVHKIIRPQVESICRMEGSKYGAREFIEGSTREQFQDEFTRELVKACKGKDLDVQLALVRFIEVPVEVRLPIQQAKIAVEESLTKEEERLTQEVFNQLQELKEDVRKGEREVDAETAKAVGGIRAQGESEVAALRAQAALTVSQLARQVAEVEARRRLVLGEADARGKELKLAADADRVKRMAEALGDPEAYATYVFARNLSNDFQISLRYAGPGTLWTDLPDDRAARGLAAIRTLEPRSASPASPGPTPAPDR